MTIIVFLIYLLSNNTMQWQSSYQGAEMCLNGCLESRAYYYNFLSSTNKKTSVAITMPPLHLWLIKGQQSTAVISRQIKASFPLSKQYPGFTSHPDHNPPQ